MNIGVSYLLIKTFEWNLRQSTINRQQYRQTNYHTEAQRNKHKHTETRRSLKWSIALTCQLFDINIIIFSRRQFFFLIFKGMDVLLKSNKYESRYMYRYRNRTQSSSYLVMSKRWSTVHLFEDNDITHIIWIFFSEDLISDVHSLA